MSFFKKEPLNHIDLLKERGAKIGQNTDIINSEIDFYFGFLVRIGNNVTITNSIILAHNASTKKSLGYSKIGCIEIGNDVSMDFGCVVFPNVRIGSKVIVGAGTVVSRYIPDNVVVVGNPYQITSSFDEYIEKKKDMKTKPVSDICFWDKTDEDPKKLYNSVKNSGGGFDIWAKG